MFDPKTRNNGKGQGGSKVTRGGAFNDMVEAVRNPVLPNEGEQLGLCRTLKGNANQKGVMVGLGQGEI